MTMEQTHQQDNLTTSRRDDRPVTSDGALIPAQVITLTARRLAKVGRMVEQQQKFDAQVAAALDRIERSDSYRNASGETQVPDADLIDTLLRILKSPNPQAERLRELLKEICKC